MRCGSTTQVEAHHLLALADGGTNHPTNSIPLCRACHAVVKRTKRHARRADQR
jgi:predicted HNH restriction endonuclease